MQQFTAFLHMTAHTVIKLTNIVGQTGEFENICINPLYSSNKYIKPSFGSKAVGYHIFSTVCIPADDICYGCSRIPSETLTHD